MAMPSSAPVSGSVTLSTWPDGLAKSTRLEISVPAATPLTGAPASSSTAPSTGDRAASSTGASLAGATVTFTTRVACSAAPPVLPPSFSVNVTLCVMTGLGLSDRLWKAIARERACTAAEVAAALRLTRSWVPKPVIASVPIEVPSYVTVVPETPIWPVPVPLFSTVS